MTAALAKRRDAKLAEIADEALAFEAASEEARQQAEKARKQDEAREAKRREAIEKLKDERDEHLAKAETACRAMVAELGEVLRLSGDLHLYDETVTRHLSEMVSATCRPLCRGERFGRINFARTWKKTDAPWLDTPETKHEESTDD